MPKRLQWLMFLRVIFTTVLLGSTIIVQFKDSESLIALPVLVLYGLVAAVYILTFIYIIVFKRLGPNLRFAYVQIGLDTLFVTFLIYVTGSIASVFSFLYLVVIIYASIFLYKKGSLIMATLCSMQYGIMIDLEYYGVLKPFYTVASPSLQGYEESYVLYKIIMTMLACFLVAFLSSSLAQQTLKTEKELKAKQKDLEQLEAINASIVHSMDSGLLTLNAANVITTFNRAAEVITGFSREEVLGNRLSSIFPVVVEDLALSNVLSKKRPYRYDVEFKKKDGTVGYLGFSMCSLKEPDGKPIGKLLIFQDLTAFRNLEEHVKRVDKLAAIGEMAAGIAHEIKNPLASMSGSIQLLKEEINVTPVVRKLMDIVLREADRLNALANDFLLFARPSSDKIEPVELSSAIGDTLELFQKNGICRNRISVVQDLAPDVWTEMAPKHTHQILWNLLLNAAEAIDGTGTIKVSLKTVEDMVRVAVKDNGCGMSQEALSKIFDPFFTTKVHGTGLGLSIVYRLLESYDGRLDVQSRQGQGSTFTLYLKRIDPPSLLS
ncbi:MAG: PAS domain S-box protein [Deltaproteobacteria bacterium]|nr:PAS domain S-box protein [Deltaproteobacteria bacterium]MBW2019928.1 PAS domain S-box protein [Deltaproteobacteria bacterium]MBW2074555.1 PAS domain S-box protein [Deltaproteobacteria bacterium]